MSSLTRTFSSLQNAPQQPLQPVQLKDFIQGMISPDFSFSMPDENERKWMFIHCNADFTTAGKFQSLGSCRDSQECRGDLVQESDALAAIAKQRSASPQRKVATWSWIPSTRKLCVAMVTWRPWNLSWLHLRR